MNTKKMFRAGLAAVLLCSSPVVMAQEGGVSGGADGETIGGYPDVEIVVTELGDTFLRNGQFVQAATLAQIQPGASGEAVTRWLGGPESVERHTGYQEWYYNINLPLNDGVSQLVCQYRVDVNAGLEVSSTQWRRQQCRSSFADFIDSMQVMSFSSDVLFDFDSAELDMDGRNELSDVALVMINQYEEPQIVVTGHTDRIGAADYNQDLSERRAAAVRSYLIERGVPGEWISWQGMGMQDPVATCLGSQVTQALKDCLAPNRRVHIRIAERWDEQ